jgi:hypothetical protein
MNWKSYALGAYTVYAIVAVMSGTAMSRAIPALNNLGRVYVGITWPGAMFCAAAQIPGCTVLPPSGSPLANAFFTFTAAEGREDDFVGAPKMEGD